MPKTRRSKTYNLYNIENKYKNLKSLANVSKFIWLMSAEDTFIYSQLYQLLNKLNNRIFFIPKIIVVFGTDFHKMKIKHRIIGEYATKR